MAFDRAKVLSKYLGDLISFVKKKAHLGKLIAKFNLIRVCLICLFDQRQDDARTAAH